MERPTPQLDLASSRNFAVLVVFLFGLFALRRPDAVLHAQFWAEDGTIIFRDQLVSGFMAALRTPYRGFFPLSARLVAGPLSLFPAYYSPLLYNATGIAIASISAGLFFLPRYRVFLRSDLLRLVLCVFAVAAFHTTELVGSLTNSMWYLTLPAILLVLLPPRLDPRSASVTTLGYSSVAAILGASSPITVAAFPIALYKAGRDFSRGGLISLAAVGGAAAQMVYAGLYSRDVTLTHPGTRQVLAALLGSFAYKVVLQSILGAGIAMRLAAGHNLLYAAPVLVISAIWLGSVAWFVRDHRQNVLIPVYLVFASIMVPLIGRNGAYTFTTFHHVNLRGERYFFLASCLVAYLVAYTIERLVFQRTELLKVVALAMVFAGGLFGNFHAEPFTDFHWHTYAKAISTWQADKRAGRSTPAVSVPINPPGWHIDLPALPARGDT